MSELEALTGHGAPFVLAVRAFCRCEVRCEAFDRTLPGALSPHDPDTWLPFDRGPMLRHASQEQEKTVRFLVRHEVPSEDLSQAKRFVSGMKLAKQEQLALSDEEFEK